MNEKLDKALEAMKGEVEKWKAVLRESTKGQDESYERQVEDAIRSVDGVMALMDQVDARNAWIKSALTFTITGICGGEVFTKKAGNIISALARGLQVMVFDSPEQLTALMGKAGGRS